MNAATGFDPFTELIELSIKEDITDPQGLIPTGDHSALCCIPSNKKGKAHLLVKDSGILAGVGIAQKICHLIDPTLEMDIRILDGQPISKGDIAFYVSGSELKILQAERLLLNFMQRMSGIATTTKKFVDAVAGTNVKVLDTRKTTPGLRAFEKLAVKIGGGYNHRFGLYDMIMLKDNHVDFCGGIAAAISSAARYQEKNGLSLPVEIETRNLDEVQQALETGKVQRIMFDNFSPEMVAKAVELVSGSTETEVSGGITLQTIRNYALAGPDFISVGALTHSSGSLDLSLKAIK